MAPLPPALKKERHRIYAKQSYDRQLVRFVRINELREQVAQLEKQYARALHRRELQEQRLVKSTTSDMEKEYLEIALLKARLRHENILLTRQISECEILAVRLERILDQDNDEKAEEEAKKMATHVIRELSMDECCDLIRKACWNIEKFRMSADYMTTGASVFGWRDRRKTDAAGNVHFSLHKTFYGTPAETLDVLWPVLLNPTLHAKLFLPALNPKVYVVQVIDDNTVVLLRVFYNPELKAVAKSLYLTARFPIKTGHMVVFQPIEHERLLVNARDVVEFNTVESIDNEHWLETFCWVLSEFVGDGCAQVEFGGVAQNTLTTSSGLWMLEVLFVLLRFEHMIYGPVFPLSSSTD